MSEAFAHGGQPHNTVDHALDSIIDMVSDTLTYLCEAPVGTPSSAAAWRVQRITISGGVTTMRYAGSGRFDQVADNRASLSYAS